jgi:hypothetical protein
VPHHFIEGLLNIRQLKRNSEMDPHNWYPMWVESISQFNPTSIGPYFQEFAALDCDLEKRYSFYEVGEVR